MEYSTFDVNYSKYPDDLSRNSYLLNPRLRKFVLTIALCLTTLGMISGALWSNNLRRRMKGQQFLSNIPKDSTCSDNMEFSVKYQGQLIHSQQDVPMNMAKSRPEFEFHGGSKGIYTIVMLDLDAPDPKNPTHAPFLHYIVSNIRADSTQFTSLISYYPVSPPIGTHRYVMYLYCQNDLITPDPALNSISRLNFDLKYFVQQHQLTKLAFTFSFVSHPTKSST